MDLAKLKDIVDVTQAVVTVAAIVVGGVWGYMLFVKRRQRYPRANITHLLTHRSITDGKLLLNVAVTISNAGDVLLSLVSGEIRIQQVLPLLPPLLDSINKGDDPVGKDQTEVQWPGIVLRKSSWEKKQIEIEPGESDQVCYDFILDAEVRTIEVYSYFKNVRKRGREIGWHLTTVYDLGPPDKSGNVLSTRGL